ncbi:MAG: hypothetical protein RLZZ15_30 [Verrucomicrobiota bacterium]|jgi:hypothetical protein
MSAMFGEQILARTLQRAGVTDRDGKAWQYHSRSDRHSKIACWAILFDLLRTSALLRDHATAGKVGFGLNHELRDFRVNRKKNLDLVVCLGKPDGDTTSTLAHYGAELALALTPAEQAALAALPALRRGAVSNVLLALEAKACMTEHVKARPRLYDELASSAQTIHGDTGSAIAAAFVMINSAASFVSPDRNKGRIRPGKFVANPHKQPDVALKVLEKIMELPRRSNESGSGFDAVGITMIRCRNDGSPVEIDAELNQHIAPIVRYDELVQRLAHLYATKFAAI